MTEDQGMVPETTPGPARSPLDAIKAQRAALADDRETLFDVPGYDGLLVIKVKLLDPKFLQKQMQRGGKSKGRDTLNAVLDTLIHATVGFYTRQDRDDPASPVQPLVDGQEVRFDAQLINLLDIPSDGQPTARKAVLGLFGGNEVAIMGFASDLMEWMQATDRELTEDFGRE